MNVLVDTNILGRIVELGHSQHAAAVDAVDALKNRGDVPCVVPQALYEFWAVATRPVAANGLGLSVAQAVTELTRLKGLIPLLSDTPGIYSAWERLVLLHSVIGKNAHDVRLVAA